MVCFQEVAPASFEHDFKFMESLGYDGRMFKKGRFRPATFWKTESCEMVDIVHKDRTLLTAVKKGSSVDHIWYVLNCHLQAGKQGSRRVRQILEGTKAVLTLARKLKGTSCVDEGSGDAFVISHFRTIFAEEKPEEDVRLVVCGDFNGGSECGAVRFLEDGVVDETFLEDGEPVTSKPKSLPLASPMTDAMTSVSRQPPPTLVVAELISQMVQGDAYANPKLSEDMLERLGRIYDRYATHDSPEHGKVMNVRDVERWLVSINGKVGRGSEFRTAAKLMGWKDESSDENTKAEVILPEDGVLSKDDFIGVYQDELDQGKFWGIAYDVAILKEPLPDVGIFESRYDRMYCSDSLEPIAVMDFTSHRPCPNHVEPSDHLPIAAAFQPRSGAL